MNKPVWVREPTAEEQTLLQACPTWEKEPSSWSATDNSREETFLVMEGAAYVQLNDGTRFRFTVGDLVSLQPHKAGDWTWHVEKKIKKHYTFDMGK